MPSARERRDAASRVVERGLVQAEEKYLVEAGASLGTWFARVQETICVGCRVTLLRAQEGRHLGETGVAGEQLGLHADVCAEAIRAVAQIWPGGTSPEVRREVLACVAARSDVVSVASLLDVLVVLARCSAALEPIANGLREEDLPMGEPTDGEAVAKCLLATAAQSFGMIHALC